MSIFGNTKDQFATGLFRNPSTGQKVNTDLHASITEPDLNSQGFNAFNKQRVGGGELFSQDIGGGKQYQEFVQRPKGYFQDESSKPTPHVEGANQVKNTSQFNIPTTVDTPVEGGGKLNAPSFYGGLPEGEESARQDELNAQIESLQNNSREEVRRIIETGRQRLGTTKGFLAKIGALGRTISGAPLETNLGVLDFQNNLIKDAVNEEHNNLAAAIAGAKEGSRKASVERIDALNKLMQQNFDNALKLAEEDRKISESDRSNKLADLQYERFAFEVEKANRDMKKENMEDALTSIDRMAESGIGLDELSLELINTLETSADLPKGTFEAYYQAKQDTKSIANEESLLKLDKLRSDIVNAAEQVKISKQQLVISQQNANTSAYSASISAQRLAFDKQKELGSSGKIIGESEFATIYMEETGTSMDPNSEEIKTAYKAYKESAEEYALLEKYKKDPTSGYKDWVLAGSEEGTGMKYDKWFDEYKKTLEERLAEGILATQK